MGGVDGRADDILAELERIERGGRRQRLRRVAARLVGCVLATALVGAGLAVGLARHRAAGGGHPHASASDAAATPEDPFRGTAADYFASGAAGIVVPAPHLTGTFPAAEVGAALSKTKAFLVLQNFDPRVQRGDLAPLYDAVAPAEGDELAARYATASGAPHLLAFATRFAAAVKTPTAATRVRGTMVTVASGPRLDIRTNYVVVYPLVTAGASRLVVAHREETFEFFRPGTVRGGDEGPYLLDSELTLYSSDCSAQSGGYLTPDPTGPPGPDAPDPRDPSLENRYDPLTPQDPRTCQTRGRSA
jgi:hypothetical protein